MLLTDKKMYEFQSRDEEKAGPMERKRERERQACRLAAADKHRDQKEQVSRWLWLCPSSISAAVI